MLYALQIPDPPDFLARLFSLFFVLAQTERRPSADQARTAGNPGATMNLTQLVILGLKASIALIVMGLFLKSKPGDLTSLLRRPSLLGRSLLSMNVIMPLVAAVIVSVMGLRPPVRIALIALMVSPVPPFLPRRQLKAGGAQPYTYGLMVVEALLSIVLVPLSVLLLGTFVRLEAPVSWSVIARIVLVTILLPLATGLVIRQLAPAFAARIEPVVSRVGLLLLILGIFPILFFAGRYVVLLLGNGTLIAMVIVALLGLVVGHVLGGPTSSDRTVLGLATSARHPGVAMAIASSTFPDQKLVPAAILLYLLVSALVGIPYLKWIELRNRPTDSAAPVAPRRDKAA